MKKVILFLLIISLFSCNRENKDTLKVNNIAIDTDVEVQFDIDSLVSNELIMSLDSNALIGAVKDICMIDSFLYILDEQSQSLNAFEYPTGMLIKQLKALGNGPEEYIQPVMLSTKGDSLFMLDFAGSSILQYDKNLNFIRKIKLELPMTDFICTNEGFICFNSFIGGNSSLVQVYDYEGHVVSAIELSSPKTEFGYKGNVFITDNNGDIYFRPLFSNVIYMYDALNHSLTPYLYVDYQRKKIPADFDFQDNIFDYSYAIMTHSFVLDSTWLMSYTIDNKRLYSFAVVNQRGISHRLKSNNLIPFFPQWKIDEYLISIGYEFNGQDVLFLVFNRIKKS